MNKKIKLNTVLTIFAILFLTASVAMNLNSNPFSEFLAGHDSSMFTYFGYAMKNGKIMYTEIFDHKGPMIFIINYLGSIIKIPLIKGIFIIEFITVFSYFLIAYRIARYWLNQSFSIVQLIPQAIIMPIYFEGGNLTEVYALPFIAYGLLTYARFHFNDMKGLHLVLSGLSFSIVFLLRPNMIALWMVFWLTVLFYCTFKNKFKLLFIYIGFFIIGILTVFIPIIIYLIVNNALEAAIFQSFIMNFMYVDTSNSKIEGIYELFKIIQRDYMTILLAAFILCWSVQIKKYNFKELLFYLGSSIFIVLTFALSVMSGRPYLHYIIVMIPTMIVPLSYLLSFFKKKSQLKYSVFLSLLVLLVYYNQLEIDYNSAYKRNMSTYIVDESHRNYRAIKSNEEKNARLSNLSNLIQENTDEADEIYVHKQSGIIYLLSNRLASVKYFNLPAIDINENQVIGKDFLKDITTAQTELIVLETKYNNQKDKGIIENEFFEFIQKKYSLIYDDVDYVIYQKK
ncbi:hypothetical protein [Marinilactibacillus psychrotolerans]|uniref:Predicted membrane protein n=1 Tax=Marinilactibacillus psychrotolerans 42ea TaxID=1255609 RepID=A0A1R4I9L8_9LACT|nr:hypothetical protein [Marinilactibacillus psychrotolerans]SJN16512.1 Predicted membrane protein [Marinilactibacillus psychrotolerans 42ea]